jgi:hypothetical protein
MSIDNHDDDQSAARIILEQTRLAAEPKALESSTSMRYRKRTGAFRSST